MQFCSHPTSFFAFPLEELGYWTIENEHQLGLESSSSATFKAIRSRLSIYIATLRSEFPLEILMLLSRGRSTGLQASFESQNDINKSFCDLFMSHFKHSRLKQTTTDAQNVPLPSNTKENRNKNTFSDSNKIVETSEMTVTTE